MYRESVNGTVIEKYVAFIKLKKILGNFWFSEQIFDWKLSLAKMQKFCIWETEYKIPKTDCIKLRCKNFASGKLDTKYLKSTASSYNHSQNCWDTFVSSPAPNVGVHDLVTESQ